MTTTTAIAMIFGVAYLALCAYGIQSTPRS